MTALPNTTKSRLLKIPQIPGVVWEGDRRPLGNMASQLDLGLTKEGECIIWVDGSEGAVRAMDVVAEDMGIEAIVRTLLRGIESPHHPGQPHRPQKIIVRDREIQFFLRGVLQDLEITIEYSPQLPLIDRLFDSFSEAEDDRPGIIPTEYKDAIEKIARKIWLKAPWEVLADSDILRVELKDCPIEEIYLCIMGMMSAEYGVLFYRSLDSLKQFRAAALGTERSPAALEKAFLAQDCWFLNYELAESEARWIDEEDLELFFGSLHPFEGMRPFVDEEEAKIIYVALETLNRFCDRHEAELSEEPIAKISQSCRVSLPQVDGVKQTITTKISTLPELTEELLRLGGNDYLDPLEETIDLEIQEDLIPDDSLITLTTLPEEIVKQLKQQSKTYCQTLDTTPQNTKLPTIFIQTTRPKAKQAIEFIDRFGGIKSVCFNPGENNFTGEAFDLGMLQTGDEELHIFAQYSHSEPENLKILNLWQQNCKRSQGYCLVAIAMGASGSNRGNPQLKDILGMYEVKSIDGADLGMGVLELVPDFRF